MSLLAHSSLSKQRPKKRSAAALQFSLVAMSLFVMATTFRITLSLHDKDSAVAYHPANPDNVLLVQPQHNIEEDAPHLEYLYADQKNLSRQQPMDVYTASLVVETWNKVFDESC